MAREIVRWRLRHSLVAQAGGAMKTYPLPGNVFFVPTTGAAGERRKRHLTISLAV